MIFVREVAPRKSGQLRKGDEDPGPWQGPSSSSRPVGLALTGATKSSDSALAFLIAVVLIFGVSNRVLYKMALVPMQNYVFFLAQIQNIGYLAVYFSILAWRFRAGYVTKSMLALDRRPFWAIGVCEAASQILFMVAASHLPGALLPVLSQLSLVWNLLFASTLLRSRFTRMQLSGAFLIMMGVALAAAPRQLFFSSPAAASPSSLMDAAARAAASHHAPHHASSALSLTPEALGVHAPGEVLGPRPMTHHLPPGVHAPASHGHHEAPAVQPAYIALAIASFAFPALASIMKEALFKREKERLGGQPLDIFIVNSFGSLYQSLFVLLLLPITTSFKGLTLSGLPRYLGEGALCVCGRTPAASAASCLGAPLLPLAYVLANLAFNIAILALLRRVGTVTSTIVTTCLLPLTIFTFTMPLPLLPPSVMGPGFFAGALLLISGLAVYNHKLMKPLLTVIMPRSASSDNILTSR